MLFSVDHFETHLKEHVIWFNQYAALYPFFLLVTAFVLWIPRKFHQESDRGLLEHLTEDMALMPISKKEMDKLVLRLRFSLFNLERYTLHKYVKLHFWTSLLMPLAVLSQCAMWNYLLDGQFGLLGFRWMSYIIDTFFYGKRHVSPLLFYFPPKAACMLSDVPPTGMDIALRGGTAKTGFSCIIPANQLYRVVSYHLRVSL